MESLKLSVRDLEHVEAYAEYRNIVGDTDDGVLLNEEEYECLRQQAAEAQKDPLLVYWRNTDGLDCRVVGPSSSCVCGHRYRDHDWMATATKKVKCRMRGCCCPLYTYIPVHGSRDIKCRCKHSYLDHDPLSRTCKKCGPPSSAGKALPSGSNSSRYHALRGRGGGAAAPAAAARGTNTGSAPANSQKIEGLPDCEASSSSSGICVGSGGTRVPTSTHTGSSGGSSKATTKSATPSNTRTISSRGCSYFSPPYTCSCGKSFDAHTTIFETASERGEPPPRLATQTLAPTGGLTGLTSLLDGVDRLSLSQSRGPALRCKDLQCPPAPSSAGAPSAAVARAVLPVCEEKDTHTARQDSGKAVRSKSSSFAKQPSEK